ncbi:MAG TPA: MoaD/ThiS family protein [Kofleriaceae bacterium]|nr:MoaD/ThiS family protein [Kofleriaceae bacterium]
MGIFDRLRGASLRIHILIRGRIGDEWRDIDTYLRVPQGTTLSELVDAAEGAGIPLRDALARSPHLADTMMLNGERCPIGEHARRPLADGDELYLLAPLAGG